MNSERYRKPFDLGRMLHNLRVKMTTSPEERDEIEEALDLSTIGAIKLTREEYDALNRKTLR